MSKAWYLFALAAAAAAVLAVMAISPGGGPVSAAEIPPVKPPDWSRYSLPETAGSPTELPPLSEDSYFWTVRGVYNLDKTGDLRKAIDCFRKAIEADSNNVAAKEHLFNALERYGASSPEIRMDKGEYGASYQWYVNAEFLLERDDLDEALNCLKRSLDMNPFNTRAAALFKEVREKIRKRDEHEAERKPASSSGPVAPPAEEVARNWYLSARYHLDKGDFQEALAAVGKALELVPGYGRAVELRDTIEEREEEFLTGKIEEEQPKTDEGIGELPPDKVGTARHWYWLGRYYAEVKTDYKQSLECLKKASILDPDDPKIQKALDEAKLKTFFKRELRTLPEQPEEDKAPEATVPLSVWETPADSVPEVEDILPLEDLDEPAGEAAEEAGGMTVESASELEFSPDEFLSAPEDIDLSEIDRDIKVIGDHEKKPMEELLEQVERSPEISFLKKKRELADIAVFLFPEDQWRLPDGARPGETPLHPVLQFTSSLSKIMQTGLRPGGRREIDETWRSQHIKDVLGANPDEKKRGGAGAESSADLTFEIESADVLSGRPRKVMALYKSHLFDILARNPDNLSVLYRLYQVYRKEDHAEAAALMFFKTNMEIQRRIREREAFDAEETDIRNAIRCHLNLFLLESAVARYNAERDEWQDPMRTGAISITRLQAGGYLPADPDTMARLELLLGDRHIAFSFAVGPGTCPGGGIYGMREQGGVSCSIHGDFPRLPEAIELPAAALGNVMEDQ